MKHTDCTHCQNTGSAIVAVSVNGSYISDFCTCPTGQRLAAKLEAKWAKEANGQAHHDARRGRNRSARVYKVGSYNF